MEGHGFAHSDDGDLYMYKDNDPTAQMRNVSFPPNAPITQVRSVSSPPASTQSITDTFSDLPRTARRLWELHLHNRMFKRRRRTLLLLEMGRIVQAIMCVHRRRNLHQYLEFCCQRASFWSILKWYRMLSDAVLCALVRRTDGSLEPPSR
jgi:hypothetical protein